MKTEISFRSIACGLLLFFIGLVALLGLFAPLGSLTAEGLSSYAENGFAAMKMQSLFYPDEDAAMIALGSFCMFQCAVGIVCMLGGVLLIFYRGPVLGKIFAIAGTAAPLLYMAAGIAFAVVYKNTQISGAGFANYSCVTYAYVPFLFSALLLAGYFVCSAKVSNRILYSNRSEAELAGEEASSGSAKKESDPERFLMPASELSRPSQRPRQCRREYSETERIELLVRYGWLYREGIITEEEFAQKKKQLLNSGARTDTGGKGA